MAPQCVIADVTPTVFLEETIGGLRQLARVRIRNSGPEAEATLVVGGARSSLGRLPSGESVHDACVDVPPAPTRVPFALEAGGEEVHRVQVAWRPPVRWTVHLVQESHHDVGYTDLSSNVLRRHDEYLDRAIEMADATAGFPDEAQFRVTVEQAWSLEHFLRRARPERAARMVELMRSGHVELTALFGNMTTELCGHEVMARCTYPSFRIARQYGVPIVSAEHNDVPGISWGLCEVLAEAGIRLFCPRIPHYYSWGHTDLRSFWDEEAMAPTAGPVAFWWESPSGRRVLFYYYHGVAGGVRSDLPALPGLLQDLEGKSYPYSVLRLPVAGGAGDNSPYSEGYAHAVRDWNARWAWPRLVCSTNARFCEDFLPHLPADLPVHRGELPGQDYPVGATSTAAATAAARRCQTAVPAAERLAALAAMASDYQYQADAIRRAYDETLWHCEHTWGHHFPCGPACEASEAEKAAHAYRAAALAQDVAAKAAARIADRVRFDQQGFHLVVFNTLSRDRTMPVSAPMREIENCGQSMCWMPAADGPPGAGCLRNVALIDRWHALPPEDLVEGRFDLLDAETGEPVPFQLADVESADDAVPYAAQRLGLGSGTRRYGFFENPAGLRRTLLFAAGRVPALGYRTYRLAPRAARPEFRGSVRATATTLENEFYRIQADRAGAVRSIVDKESGRELVDADAPHPVGGLVVRTPGGEETCGLSRVKVRRGWAGPVCGSIEITGAAHAHPRVRLSVRLWSGMRRVELAARILKDPTPLLDVHLAFPFLVAEPRFRYQGALSVMEPIADFLPGAYSDRLAVQNWVKVAGGGGSILWSSLDAPTASLGALWRGYVSPAHSAVVAPDLAHPPLQPGDLKHGWLYSGLFANNFGTNFSVSQTGDVLFRYVFTSMPGDADDGAADAFGWDAVTPAEAIFSSHDRERTLPPCSALARLDSEATVLLACKQAEDGRGYVLRLWNPVGRADRVCVRLPHLAVGRAWRTSLAEEAEGEELACSADGFEFEMPARSMATVRVAAPEAR